MNKAINTYRIKSIAVAYIFLLAFGGIASLVNPDIRNAVFYLYLLPSLLPLILASWISNLIFGPDWSKIQTRKAAIRAGMKDFGLISLITGAFVGGMITAAMGFADLVSVALGALLGLAGGLILALPVGFTFGGYFGCKAFEMKA